LSWGNVAEIIDAGDAMEVHMHDGGLAIVRDKGFPETKTEECPREKGITRLDDGALSSVF
jgi:hypothetical protein